MSRDLSKMPCSKFSDPGRLPDNSQFATQQVAYQGTQGTPYKLQTNCFNLVLGPSGCIYHYHYELSPEPAGKKEEQRCLEFAWSQLQKEFGPFVIRCPKHIFSPHYVSHDLEIHIPADKDKGFQAHTLKTQMFEKFIPDQVNGGLLADAEVVLRHVVKKLAQPLMHEKVGRRYYCNHDLAEEGRGHLQIFSGFYVALGTISQSGPYMHIDTTYRALHKRSVIETIASSLETGNHLALKDPEVQALWRQKCLSSTVVTLYNNRVYRIKAVHFDKTPQDPFTMFQRDEGLKKTINFVQYYQAYYQREIMEHRQPLLEAVPEKESERVFLVPELCALTGFNDEMRKDKMLMNEAVKLTKVAPQERLSTIQFLAEEMKRSCAPGTTTAAAKMMKEWKFSFSSTPIEVDARQLETVQVNFGQKQFAVEEGNFQRWMRHGLQVPTHLEKWLFIYPESDVAVLDIWLRSLRDISQVAFSMKMEDPQRVVCTDQRNEIVNVLNSKVTPQTQLVLLLTPHKDCKKVYQLFKQTACSKLPCVTQVVKSETIRKRQSIAAVLSRIVLQINAKFCGPLWHIDLVCPSTKPAFTTPTMTIGIDVFVTHEDEQYYGFAASLDTNCTEYFSNSGLLQKGKEKESMSVKLQECVRDALLHFARRNDGSLPEHLIVYRGSLNPSDWVSTHATEVEAINRVLKAVKSTNNQGNQFSAKLTFVAVAKRTAMRFFQPSSNEKTVRNPEWGTVVDSPVVGMGKIPSFYLINQAVGKGTAVPTQFIVLHDTAQLSANALQNLTYRLAFLYFNYTGSIRVPAPLQYAKKIAHLIGTAVRAEPHKRLLKTFFYL